MDRYLYNVWIFALGLFVGLVASEAGFAAKKPFHHVFDKSKKKYFISNGRFSGGEVDRPINLVDVQFDRSPKGGRERLLLKFADQKGEVLQKKLGYVHVSVESRPARVVMDLDQVVRTSVDGPGLNELLKKSKMIIGNDITMDPQDYSTNMTLQLKEPQTVSVFTMKDKAGGLLLAIEIREKKSARK